MTKIVILPDNDTAKGRYLATVRLPLNYMGDFSVMGFIVKRHNDALALLETSGYSIEKKESGAEVRIDSPASILQIKDLLIKNDIYCKYADVADTFYQA